MDAALHLLPVELVDRLFRLLNLSSRRALMLTCRRLAALGKALPWTQRLAQTWRNRIPSWVISTGPFYQRIDGSIQADPRATEAAVCSVTPPDLHDCPRLTRVSVWVSSTGHLGDLRLAPSVHTLCLQSPDFFQRSIFPWGVILPPTVRHLELMGGIAASWLDNLPPTVVSVRFLFSQCCPSFGLLSTTLRLISFDWVPAQGRGLEAWSHIGKASTFPALVAIVTPGVTREQILFAPNLQHFSQRNEDWERFKAMLVEN